MLYDTIGQDYIARRLPDPRIAALIHSALEGVESIVNVGAGTGSYEPTDVPVVAIEPSMTMIRQRPLRAAPAIQALAQKLPLRDGCSFGATAILTVHHWPELTRGLEELCRISRDRIAILTWDPDAPDFWLTNEYFPAVAERDRKRFPAMSTLSRILGKVSVRTVPVPGDCVDGFLGAYWRRPHAYLDARIRSAMSGFVDLPALEEGLLRLHTDLASGCWQQRFRHLLDKDCIDIGYRLVIARVQ